MRILKIISSLFFSSSDSSNPKPASTYTDTFELPKDVLSKIEIEYPTKRDQKLVKIKLDELVEKWELTSARVPRCVLFLANGDLDRFHEHLKYADRDWRDVIYWAECEGDFENHKVERVRDFEKTFKENEV